MSPSPDKKIRVLIAKPGLDGHDVGAKLVCRALMAAGMEVIYTGLRASPDEIAQIAQEEAVDVVGLSVLSGAHLPLARKVGEALAQRGLDEVLWIIGGNIPTRDHEALLALGIKRVFPTGSNFDDLCDYVRDAVRA